jgi:hypothetical protein
MQGDHAHLERFNEWLRQKRIKLISSKLKKIKDLIDLFQIQIVQLYKKSFDANEDFQWNDCLHACMESLSSFQRGSTFRKRSFESSEQNENPSESWFEKKLKQILE